MNKSLIPLRDLRAAADAEWVGPWPKDAIAALCDLAESAHTLALTRFRSEEMHDALDELHQNLRRFDFGRAE